ncbi:MAG: DUF4350 domain-containing protein, partial [Bacteroidota bacterium]
PPFEVLEDSTVEGQTYAFLANAFAPDDAEADRLLRFVARGNTLFIAAGTFGGRLGARLGAAADTAWDGRRGLRSGNDPGFSQVVYGDLEVDSLQLVARGGAETYAFPIYVGADRIEGIDSTRTEVLGVDLYGDLTLVRVRHGAGQVVLSSTPLAFTNAALTGDGDAEAYVGAVLAALPDQPVWWDDHHKTFRQNAQTPLRYVLQTPALRWAYVLLLLAFGLFVAFRGRRWQRPIPVVAPPPNAQREFARTVGRLHLVHGDEIALAHKKVRVVLDRMRTALRIPDADLSDETARLAAARAGVPEEEARALFATLDRVRRERRVDADTLIRLDRRVDAFFRHTSGAAAPADPARGDS